MKIIKGDQRTITLTVSSCPLALNV